MIKINYDPILGCTGWMFTNLFDNKSKKKNITNKIIKNKNKKQD